MSEQPREQYLDLVRRELLGPGAEPSLLDAETDVAHERLAANPNRLYLLGILYPQDARKNTDAPLNYGSREDVENYMIDDVDAERDLTDVSEDALLEVTAVSKNSSSDDETDDETDDGLDEAFSMAAQFLPASMGLLCLTEGSPDGAQVNISFGTYRRAKEEQGEFWVPYQKPTGFDIPGEYEPFLNYDKIKERLYLVKELSKGLNRDFRNQHKNPKPELREFMWKVSRLAIFSREGRVRIPNDFRLRLNFDRQGYFEEDLHGEGGKARLIARKREITAGRFSLTLMLVNLCHDEKGQAENCLYQAEIKLEASEEDGFHFTDTRLSEPDLSDTEEDSLRLLYHGKQNYATGLGTAAAWKMDDEGYGYVRTDFFPIAETPQMDWGSEERSMKDLSSLSSISREKKLESLQKLVSAYERWISSLENKAEQFTDIRFKQAAARNIGLCRKAAQRMATGIEVLRENDLAFEAFELANRAMFMQRVQLRMQGDRTCQTLEERWPSDKKTASWLQNVDYKAEPDEKDGWRAYWRPFQIAFILMVIPDVVDDHALGREFADLIWFPTGGGKTEAYLGLTAFTICYRRLAHTEAQSGGTTIIMRYTLRLLTAQQFNRASTLICALEIMRREGIAKLGNESITIGLWVGQATPKKCIKGSWEEPSADMLLKKIKDYSVNVGNIEERKERYNRFQVLKCPWCGTKLERGVVSSHGSKKLEGVWGYGLDQENHFHFFCPQRKCPFNDEYFLPIQVIDEEIYRNPPTLLFATVDKFAQMPWQGDKVGKIFGADKKERRAPELIIQDELHLISGALGTMVGLYEVALDAACQHKGVKPKIIASTATIRRATEQCAALYERQAFQFPPPGLESGDSFFAREKVVSKKNPGRKYVGLMPSGKTKTVSEIRVLAVLLEMVKAMPGLSDEEMDKLWTLTAYFNSLRELGRADTLVMDEVRDAMHRISFRLDIPCRSVYGAKELTSRVTAIELNQTLDALEHLTYSQVNREQKRYAVNVLLATNMISVGLDVARLNLMLVVGQPKLTSEYIQSTSRIGRQSPGVALVLYRPTNSRDRSYYEHFQYFHRTFYSQVEPSVVTPFSRPALCRGLHAVLVSMMRLGKHTYEIFVKDDSAIKFDLQNEVIREQAEWSKNFLLRRQRRAYELAPGLMSAEEMDNDLRDLEQLIDGFFQAWDEEATYASKDAVKLCFGHSFLFRWPSDGERILLATRQRVLTLAEMNQEKSEQAGPAIETMSSLRSVDDELKGSLITFQERVEGEGTKS
ncbi:helicase-related protein [Selenomonas ruminantium]|uniref:helicase-related protein n=1 Tax=Selenomonas ruminantium TaxID=971 RepID=UPI0026E93E18|nr:helicase-related protein [Selenomonas ruminantium]